MMQIAWKKDLRDVSMHQDIIAEGRLHISAQQLDLESDDCTADPYHGKHAREHCGFLIIHRSS